ncbi:Carnosine N-methyltransferase [Hypsizygus marmoreus]|uniref:Carnosine N-methyltransferase n=1 Tax=Hypsizygus marmoreus TaxID=39966 RepID=A0A369IY01_HYPMA|nr:Carnosine N-methyltransferase [Hypsizygus marmoreus]
MASNSTCNFDIFLACLFPLTLFLVVLRANATNIWTWTRLQDFLSLRAFKTSPYGPFSLEKAHQSYAQYGRLARMEVASRQASYNSLGRAYKRLGNKIGYPAKLETLKHVTDLNSTITDAIAELAEKEFNIAEMYSGSGDLGRVRESLKHFIRDWSEEGAQERDKIFHPILDVLREVDPSERATKRVLVPGSGLGRLAWEISQLGFDTTANELSFFMSFAFRFLVSPETTTSKNEHTLRPYAHWFSHQRSNDSLFRAISFPDAVPRLTPTFRLLETDFLKVSAPADANIDSEKTFTWSKSDSAHLKLRQSGYDYIVTLFFIDTSLNVFATMEHIYTLLRPGGTWINLGPLLWTSGGQAKLELSLDEVIRAAEEIGFIFEIGGADASNIRANKTIECEYTGDHNAMMRWIYKAEFWVASKSK